MWNGLSWDPDLGLVYIGTAQAKPWVAVSRGLTTADSTLYANSTLALDVETGRMVWYRQHVPGESLDMDEGFEQVLADIDGVPALLYHRQAWRALEARPAGRDLPGYEGNAAVPEHSLD